MKQNALPTIKLQETDVLLTELLTRFKGEAVGFQLPQQAGMLLLLSAEDYDVVAAAIQPGELYPPVLPGRPPSTLPKPCASCAAWNSNTA